MCAKLPFSPELINGRTTRALGVTELLMPLPGVMSGRSPATKKGPGAITSIFQLLPPRGEEMLEEKEERCMGACANCFNAADQA